MILKLELKQQKKDIFIYFRISYNLFVKMFNDFKYI